MNVGGIPGTNLPSAFLIVVVLMAAIAIAQYWYFRRRGWFE
jgi:Mg2+ and Co2+ transporter CorA